MKRKRIHIAGNSDGKIPKKQKVEIKNKTLDLVEGFGVSTSKFTTGFVSDCGCFADIPLGCCITRWDVKNKKRILLKQLSQSVIVFMEKRDDIVLVCSNQGVISFWNLEYTQQLWEFDLPAYAKVYHLNWKLSTSKDQKLLVCCDFEKEHCESILVIRFNIAEKRFNLLGRVLGDFEFCGFTKNDGDEKTEFIAIQQDDENPKLGARVFLYSSKLQKMVDEEQGEEEEDGNFGEASVHLELKKKQIISSEQNVTCTTSSLDSKYLACATSDRNVVIIDTSSFTVLVNEFIEGAKIYCMQFIKNPVSGFEYLYAANHSGTMVCFDIPKKTSLKFKIPRQTIHWFRVFKDIVFMSNESSFKAVKFRDSSTSDYNFEVLTRIGYLSIAGCGITKCDKTGSLICGDLAGNVFCFDSSKNQKSSVISQKKVNVGIGVRSVCLYPNSSNVQVGTFDGICWNVDLESDMKVERLFGTTSCINSMKWEKKAKPMLFACGTSGGNLIVLEKQLGEKFLRIRFSIMAHRPWSSAEERFGTINKFSEIWSLDWCPPHQSSNEKKSKNDDEKSSFIATGSEDQTVRIFDAKTGRCVHMLTGHRMAVTCVVWERIRDGTEEVIISCSDDCKILIWRNNGVSGNDKTKWYLEGICETHNIGIYWHTLTYMGLLKSKEYKRDEIVVVTQNGYCIIFDLSKRTVLFKNKIHTGSCEGLYICEDDSFATISGDCSIALWKVL